MLNSKTFRIFISSTFSDYHQERTRLQDDVFPRLEKFCQSRGYRFQPIDLRWGITSKMGEAQETMKVCLDEIRRCQRVTPSPNFVILLGDRYGWQPIPSEIPEEEFKMFHAIANTKIKQSLETWYWPDLNSVPCTYVLQAKVDDLISTDEWNEQEKRLQEFFCEAVKELPIKDSEKVRYYGSATEQEIWLGALNKPELKSNTFAFIRTIENLSPDCFGFCDFTTSESGFCIDENAARKIGNLKKQLFERLPPERILSYRAKLKRDDSNKAFVLENSCGYLDRFAEDFFLKIKGAIESEIFKLESIRANVDDDWLTQENFLAEKVRCFVGRKELNVKVFDYISSKVNKPLAIIGKPGSGKSSFLAKCLSEVRNRFPDFEISYLFVGLTANSSSIVNVLARLGVDLNPYFEKGILGNFMLREAFLDRLKLASSKKPLIVFLDALDQIIGGNEVKKLAWLPMELPENVRLIVSTIDSDQTNFALQESLSCEQILRMGPLEASESSELLFAWLSDYKRTLTAEQTNAVLNDYASQTSPLYLKLVFEGARKWRSYQPVVDRPDSTIEGVIKQFLTQLGKRYGEVLVEISLCHLVVAKNGLSEDELLELLFLDEEFRAWFDKESHFELPTGSKRIPVSVWSGLYFELEPFLVEKMVDGIEVLGFFHRLFYEVIKDMFLSDVLKTRMHRLQAEYFEKLDNVNEHGELMPSKRKMSELPFHQTLGFNFPSLVKSLGSVEFIEAKLRYDAFSLLEDFALFEVHCRNFDSVETSHYIEFLIEVADFVRRKFHFIHQCPELFVQFAANEPDFSKVSKGVKQQLLINPNRKYINYVNRPQKKSNCKKTFSPPDKSHGKLQKCVFSEETGNITGLFTEPIVLEFNDGIFNADSLVKTISLKEIMQTKWNLESGRLVEQHKLNLVANTSACSFANDGQVVFCDHLGDKINLFFTESNEKTAIEWAFSEVRLFEISHGFKYFAFACLDGSVVVYDNQSQQSAKLLYKSSYQVLCLKLDEANDFMYVGNADGNVSLWNLKTGKRVRCFSKVSVPVHCLQLFSGNRILAGGDAEGFIKFWKTNENSEIFVLQAHESPVVSMNITQDGLLYTAEAEGAIKIWDTKAIVEELQNKEEKDSGFWGGFSPAGKFWAYWGEGRLGIWDTINGKRLSSHSCKDGKYACAFSSDGRLFFIKDRQIMYLTPENLLEPVLFFKNTQEIQGLNSSFFNEEIAFWTSKRIIVLDSKTGTCKSEIFAREPRNVAFSNSEVFLVFQTSNTLNMVKENKKTNELTSNSFRNFTENCEDFCFSPDGEKIFSWFKGDLRSAFVEGKSIEKPKKIGVLAGFSGEHLFVIVETGEIIAFDYKSIEEVERIRITDKRLLNAQFSTDGEMVATINQNNILQFWNWKEKAVLSEFGVEGYFNRIVWSRDNNLVTLEGDDPGEFLIFELPV